MTPQASDRPIKCQSRSHSETPCQNPPTENCSLGCLGSKLLRLLYRTVRSYSQDIVEPYCGWSFLELVPSTFVSRCLSTPECVSPNVKLLIQYVLYHVLHDFSLARVHQHTSILSAEVSLAYRGTKARLSPRAMAPSLRKENLGLANPRGGMYIE